MSGPIDLTDDERELLLALATEQERYEARTGWSFAHTLWSRVTYTMASARGRLTPTHLPGKFDMDRAFERAFRRIVQRLVKRGLVRFRPIGTHRQPRQTLGYRGHEARVRDLFLTEAGKALVALLREEAAPPAPDGDLAPPPAAVPEPDGDLGGSPRQAIPEPDGDPGWPAPSAPRPAAPASEPALALEPSFLTPPTPPPDDGGLGADPRRRPRVVPRPRAERTPRRDDAPRPRAARRGR